MLTSQCGLGKACLYATIYMRAKVQVGEVGRLGGPPAKRKYCYSSHADQVGTSSSLDRCQLTCSVGSLLPLFTCIYMSFVYLVRCSDSQLSLLVLVDILIYYKIIDFLYRICTELGPSPDIDPIAGSPLTFSHLGFQAFVIQFLETLTCFMII